MLFHYARKERTGRRKKRDSEKKLRKGLEGSRGGKLNPEKFLYNKQEIEIDC